jgi:predicted phage terminase large subunit-like protein
VIMQRLNKDDLSAHIMTKNDYAKLTIKAQEDEDRLYEYGQFRYFRAKGELLNVKRDEVGAFEQLKQDIGSQAFACQYQQNPLVDDNSVIKLAWFAKYQAREHYSYIVQSWDCAASSSIASDYSVGITFGVKDKQIHILDVVRARFEYPALRSMAQSYYHRYLPSYVLIENKSSGQALLQDLKNSHLPVIALLPKTDKISRLYAVLGFIESGLIALPCEAPWLLELVSELTSFPHAPHDDQVDALTQFLEWFSKKSSNHKLRLI